MRKLVSVRLPEELLDQIEGSRTAVIEEALRAHLKPPTDACPLHPDAGQVEAGGRRFCAQPGCARVLHA